MSEQRYSKPEAVLTVIESTDVLTASGDGFDGPSHGFFDSLDDVIHAPKDWFIK